MATSSIPVSAETATTGRARPAATVQKQGERPSIVRWLLVLGGLAGVVWFAPEIVARTSLRQQAPRWLCPQFAGAIELGETSLSWFQPIEIRNIVMDDSAGQPLARIGRLRSTSTLWEILTNARSWGRFELERTVVSIRLNARGPSNWGTALAGLSGDQSTAPPKAVSVAMPEVTIQIDRGVDAPQQSLSAVTIAFERSGPDEKVITVTATLPQETTGEPALTVTARTTAADGRPTLSCDLTARQFELARIESLCQVGLPEASMRGILNGSLHAECATAETTSWTVRSDLQATDALLAGWPALSGDVVQFNTVTATGTVHRADGHLECDHFQIKSDFATVAAHGRCTWASLTELSSGEPSRSSMLSEDFECAVSVDAAGLAQRFPRWLRLREGVTVTAGTLQTTIKSVNGEQGRSLDGTLQWANLAANIDGHPWQWTAPVEGHTVVRPTEHGWVCDRLTLDSEFIRILGQGTLDAARFRVTADLDRLWQEVAPLVDAEGCQLAGSIRIDGTIQRQEPASVALHIDGHGQRLSWGPTQQPVWQEQALEVTVEALGQGTAVAPWATIASGKLQLASGDDRLVATITEPVATTAAKPSWPVSLDVVGDWSRWQRRLQPIVATPDFTVAGTGQLTANVVWSSDTTTIHTANLSSKPLQLLAATWQIDDGDVTVATSGAWDALRREWTTPKTTIASQTGQVTWTNGRFHVSDDPFAGLAGDVDLDIDVGRISRWQRGDVRHHLLGQATGQVHLTPTENTQTIAADVQLSKLVVAGLSSDAAPRWLALWREPAGRLSGTIHRRGSSGAVEFESARWQSDGLSLTASGRLTPRADAVAIQCQGQIGYDWERVMSRLDKSWSDRLQLTGQGARPFSVRGEMLRTAEGYSFPQLDADASVNWDRALVYGVALEPAELAVRLADGQGQLGPLDAALAEGRVHLAPQFDLRTTPVVMLPAGRVIDQVQLSPELCRRWLKYAAPLIADAAEIDGRFSVDVAQAAWPLSDPARGEARGSLLIAQAQVRPGASMGQLTGVVEQVRSLLERRPPRTTVVDRLLMELPQQTVQFSQAQNRVEHDQLQMRIGNVDLVSHGSVGFDESLQLVLDVPVHADWVQHTPALAKLAGQSIRVPVYGTLAQPQIDPRVFAEIARQAAGSAVERVLDDTLQKQLNRFLPRKN